MLLAEFGPLIRRLSVVTWLHAVPSFFHYCIHQIIQDIKNFLDILCILFETHLVHLRRRIKKSGIIDCTLYPFCCSISSVILVNDLRHRNIHSKLREAQRRHMTSTHWTLPLDFDMLTDFVVL